MIGIYCHLLLIMIDYAYLCVPVYVSVYVYENINHLYISIVSIRVSIMEDFRLPLQRVFILQKPPAF